MAQRKGGRRSRGEAPKFNTFHLQVLGPVRLVDRKGRSILSVVSQPRRVALLAYLALATDDGMADRTRLVSMFWPDLDPEEGLARLDRTLRALIRSLTRSTVVNDGNGRVGVCRDRVLTDVARLEEALDRADMREATQLYRGPFLAGIELPGLPEVGAWLEGERHRLAARFDALTGGGGAGALRSSSPAGSASNGHMDGHRTDPLAPPATAPETGSDGDASRRKRFVDLVLGLG